MSFLAELSFKDLQRLRAVVKKEWIRYYPAELYTDREADRLIDAMGPEIAEQQIKRSVDERVST
jgi:hypothetical protein